MAKNIQFSDSFEKKFYMSNEHCCYLVDDKEFQNNFFYEKTIIAVKLKHVFFKNYEGTAANF